MAAAITPNLTLISACDATTGWSGGTLITVDQIQNTGCLGDAVNGTPTGVLSTLRTFDFGAGTEADMSGTDVHLWMWMKVNGQVHTQANGGYRLYAEDSSGNYSYWYVGGSDTHPPGWKCLVTSISATRDSGSGTLNTSAIRRVGVQMNVITPTRIVGKSVVENIFWDISRYGTGLTITSGATDGIGWEEIFAIDDASANKYGAITKSLSTGVYELQGKFILGDGSGTGSVDFDDTNEIAIFQSSSYFSDTFNGVVVAGNGTGTTNFMMGDVVDGQGVSGCVIKSSGSKTFSIDATDTDIDILKLYGCTLVEAGSILLPPDATGREVLTSVFSGCDPVEADTCVVQHCKFVSPTSTGVIVTSTSHNVTDCVFIDCTDAIEITTAGTYDLDNNVFYNSTYDIDFSGTGVLVVNNINGSNASTYHMTGGGTSVTIYTMVPLTVYTFDQESDPVPAVRCSIFKSSDDTELMNEDSTALGVATENYDYPGTPVPIYWRVRESNPAGDRYKPKSGIGTIAEDGYSVTVVMEPEPIQE